MDEASTALMVERVRGGDEQAFAELVRRHETTLLRYARGLLGRGGAFEDAVQDAFLKLARNPPRLAVEEPANEHKLLGRWLLQVTRNHCMDWMRAERRRRRREGERALPDAAATASSGLDTLEAKDARAAVESHLAALPETQREVLVLRLLGDKSYREIAAVTGKSIGTVGWLISRGLQRLASELDPALDPQSSPALARRTS
ncbi:MAG: RNA polymerase sigma factor [Planctomycetota bacterium]